MALKLQEVGGHLEYVDEKGQQCTIRGELVADSCSEYSMGNLFAEFYETPLGEEFLAEFGVGTKNPRTDEANSAVIERVFKTLYTSDPRPTLTRVADAVRVAIDAGELTPIPKPTVVRNRSESGRFLSEHDRLRAVVRALLDDPNVSAQSIRERANKEKAFGDAFRAEVSAAPTATVQLVRDPELEEFAEQYTKAPSLRPIAGFITLGGKKYLVAEFNEKVERAIAAGCLR
jgi:hypothetical protein